MQRVSTSSRQNQRVDKQNQRKRVSVSHPPLCPRRPLAPPGLAAPRCYAPARPRTPAPLRLLRVLRADGRQRHRRARRRRRPPGGRRGSSASRRSGARPRGGRGPPAPARRSAGTARSGIAGGRTVPAAMPQTPFQPKARARNRAEKAQAWREGLGPGASSSGERSGGARRGKAELLPPFIPRGGRAAGAVGRAAAARFTPLMNATRALLRSRERTPFDLSRGGTGAAR